MTTDQIAELLKPLAENIALIFAANATEKVEASKWVDCVEWMRLTGKHKSDGQARQWVAKHKAELNHKQIGDTIFINVQDPFFLHESPKEVKAITGADFRAGGAKPRRAVAGR